MHWDVTVCTKAFFFFLTEIDMRIHRYSNPVPCQTRAKGITIAQAVSLDLKTPYSQNTIRLSWMLRCYDIPALMRMSITQTVMDFLITILSCGICHPKFFRLAPVLLKLNCGEQKYMQNENTRGRVRIYAP